MNEATHLGEKLIIRGVIINITFSKKPPKSYVYPLTIRGIGFKNVTFSKKSPKSYVYPLAIRGTGFKNVTFSNKSQKSYV